MKPVVVVALNVVTVVIALVAYDVLRSGPTPEGAPFAGPADAMRSDGASDEILARLSALESGRPRVRRGSGTDPALLARLDALEEALGDLDGAEPAPATEEGRDGDTQRTPSTSPTLDEPTAAEIRRFRRLQDAVWREDALEKNRKRLDATLDGLPIRLTDEEREGVHRAYAAFRPRVDEIWGEVKQEARRTVEAGGTIDRDTLVADATAVIQQEFTEVLGNVVSAADSRTIAEALMPGGK